MCSRQSVPDNIGNIARNVIEGSSIQIRLVRKGQERNAGSDTRAKNPNTFIPLTLQPTHSSTRIKHRLAHRLNASTNICANQMIGALQLGRSALLVIGKSQT